MAETNRRVQARRDDRENVAKLIQNGTPLVFSTVENFTFLTRFLTSQVFVKIGDRSPFLDLVLRLSCCYDTDKWVVVHKTVSSSYSYISIDFRPIIWMLVRINEPEMQDMLAILTSEQEVPYVDDFYTGDIPTCNSMSHNEHVLRLLLRATELSDFEGDQLERAISERWNTFCAVCGLEMSAVVVTGSRGFDGLKPGCTCIVRQSQTEEVKALSEGAKFCIFVDSGKQAFMDLVGTPWLTRDFNAGGFLQLDKGYLFEEMLQKSGNIGASRNLVMTHQLFWAEVMQLKVHTGSTQEPVQDTILSFYIQKMDLNAKGSVRECNMLTAATILYPRRLTQEEQQRFSNVVLWLYCVCAADKDLQSIVIPMLHGLACYKVTSPEMERFTIIVVLLAYFRAIDRQDEVERAASMLRSFLVWPDDKMPKEIGLDIRKTDKDRDPKQWLEHDAAMDNPRAPCRSVTAIVRDFLDLLDTESWESLATEFGTKIQQIEGYIKRGLHLVHVSY